MEECEISESHRSLAGKIGSAGGTVVLVLVVAAAAFVMASPLFGWRVDTVLSGSMEPALHAGDMIVTRPVAAGTIREGDIVTYSSRSGNSHTTHRVVAVEREPALRFVTKGDANRDIDPAPIPAGQVAGVFAFSIPYLGILVGFIRTPLGLALTVGIPAVVLIAAELEKLWSKGAD
jgi:signal peptidase